ncbi:MAG: hypothetical protein GHHEDOFH_03647 [Pseudorhodoplanes sp.]|nr:hypothetical protein [Pseudorhodoplanes sp.]
MRVEQPEVHRQVRGERLGPEVRGRRTQSLVVAQVLDQRIDQRAAALAPPPALDEAFRPGGQRHEVPAQPLRQRLRQRLHLVSQHAGHQPLAAHLVDLVQHRQRHRQGGTVVAGTRIETVVEVEIQAAHREAPRKRFGAHRIGALPEQRVARQLQQRRIGTRRRAPPALERLRRMHVLRNARVVPVEQLSLVDQQVGAADALLERFDLGHQPPVVHEEAQTAVPVAADQRPADHQFARQPRIDRAIVHAPLRVDRQPVEHAALAGHRLAGALRPRRVGPAAPDQVRTGALDPRRLDARYRARVQASGLDHLGGHHPARCLLRQRRTGVDRKLRLVRAGVLQVVGRLEAEVAQQAAEQRLVDRLAGGRTHVGMPLQRARRLDELRVHFCPVAQPPRRQELALEALGELAVRLLFGLRLRPVVPQFHEGEEIGVLVREAPMRMVGRLLRVERPLARILRRQRRGDHRDLAQAVELARREQHAAYARVHRQHRQLPAGRGEPVRLVHRAQFLQQRVAVGDRLARRGIEKRELLDVGQPQRLHPQDHRRQRRAQDLRVREARPLCEVGLVVEPDAHAVGDAPAAPGALVGGGLRNRLDLQLLDLAAIAVALDARQSRIDHVADAGHGERSLGDVGREHDAPPVGAGEHALLFGRRQARIQRQDLDRPARPRRSAARRALARVQAAQMVGHVANLALAGQEHEYVAGRLAPQRLDRLVDPRRQVGFVLVVAVAVVEAPVADLHRIEPPRDFDHGCRLDVLARRPGAPPEMPGEALGVDRRRGDDQLQVVAPRPFDQLLQVAEQEVDVQAALVRLVDDEGVVLREQRIRHRLGQQDPVGHQLDRGTGRQRLVEADLVAHMHARRRAEFLGDAPGHRGRRQPPRLRVADQPAAAAAGHRADLGKLGGLARAGLATDDDHRMAPDRVGDLVTALRDGQRPGKPQRGQRAQRRRGPLHVALPGRHEPKL